jgi:PleD family two-component response regulator
VISLKLPPRNTEQMGDVPACASHRSARGCRIAGVAQWNGYESADALIDRADLALYNAKRSGRDRATAAASGR